MENLLCIHPGETLLEDFMLPYNLTAENVAEDIGVCVTEVSELINAKRAITADMALRLGRYFGTSAKIWMRLQARYDLEVAQQNVGSQIERDVKIHPPARQFLAAYALV